MHSRSLSFAFTQIYALHSSASRIGASGSHEPRQTRKVSFIGRLLDAFVFHSARRIFFRLNYANPLENGNRADEFVTAIEEFKPLQADDSAK